jgi:hypothetical protein
VTSQGSAYSQFKRALTRRNLLLAWTMAAELPKVPLADALSLLLLALDQQPWRFETAAPRWHARLCHEARLRLPVAQLAPAGYRRSAAPARSAVSDELMRLAALGLSASMYATAKVPFRVS